MVFFSHREARIKITASHEQVREELSSAIAEIGTCNEGSARLSATITDLETSVGPTQCAMHWCLGGKESHCRVVPHYFSYKCFSPWVHVHRQSTSMLWPNPSSSADTLQSFSSMLKRRRTCATSSSRSHLPTYFQTNYKQRPRIRTVTAFSLNPLHFQQPHVGIVCWPFQ